MEFTLEKPIKKKVYKGYEGYDPEKSDAQQVLQVIGLNSEDEKISQMSNEEILFVCYMMKNNCDKNRAYMEMYNLKVLTNKEYGKISILMRNENVKYAIRTAVQKKMSECTDNLDAHLLDTYITRAFYDPMDFYLDNGDVRPLSEIDPQLRKAVFEGQEKKYYGKDADAYTVTYKLANKENALKTLSEFMGKVRPNSATELKPTSVQQESDEEQQRRLEEMSVDELLAQQRALKEA